jgi:hypothetical protein
MGAKAQMKEEGVSGQRIPQRQDGEWVSIPGSLALLPTSHWLMSDFTALGGEQRALVLEPGRLIGGLWASVALNRLLYLLESQELQEFVEWAYWESILTPGIS